MAEENTLSNEIFHVQSVCDIVQNPKNQIPPRQIFGKYVYKNEITVIGGTDNTGKSILGMDLLLAATTGTHFWGDQMTMGEPQMKGLLIDTELNNSQFTRRYLKVNSGENLLRASIWPTIYGRKTPDEVLECLEETLQQEGCPKLVVVDNLSTIGLLSSGNQMQHFLSELKRMKELYGITMVLITHLNKVPANKPISKDEFRGSKQLTNMADTVVGIGNTCLGDEYKYISLLKSRNVAKPATIDVVKILDDPHPHFEFVCEDEVENVLPKKRKSAALPCFTPALGDQVQEMLKAGLELCSIADTLGIDQGILDSILNDKKEKGNGA